MFCFVFLAERW